MVSRRSYVIASNQGNSWGITEPALGTSEGEKGGNVNVYELLKKICDMCEAGDEVLEHRVVVQKEGEEVSIVLEGDRIYSRRQTILDKVFTDGGKG